MTRQTRQAQSATDSAEQRHGRDQGGIGVAMCTYNGSAYVQEQLESIARQTRLPESLVVVDDRSADKTRAIVRSFSRQAPFPVRIVTNETNLGFGRNFGKAIALAEGEFIALADQDDVWRDDKLERVEACFRQWPDVGMVFTDADLVDADLCPLGHRLWEAVRFTPSRQRNVRGGRAFERLLRECYATGATMVFRSRFRSLILPIPEQVPHDAWIALVIAAVGEIDFISEPLVRYRQHGGNQIGAEYTGGLQRWSEQRSKNTHVLHQSLLRARAVRERLLEDSQLSGDRRRILDEVIRHLSVRTNLPNSKFERMRPIIDELMAGRYRGPLGGVPSAARDLLL